MKTIKLNIKGMHCTACAINIDFDLEDIDGVESAKTSYAKQQTELEYDEKKVSLDKIVNQIKTTGYEVSP